MKTFVTVVLALLASCKSEPTPAIANVGSPAAVATTIPTGWIAIEPDDERMHCANYASDEWQVAIHDGAAVFSMAKPPGGDTGPTLPFTPKQPTPEHARQHVVAVSDGFLVGYDAGEWGGALVWYSKDGGKEVKLTEVNVRGLVAIGPDLVASIEGLSHMIDSEGDVRWIEHRGTWKAGALTALGAAPSTFVATTDALYVVTTEKLMRVGMDRKATAIQPVRTATLYPDSMAIDRNGELWIGMRQFVMRMTPNGKQFTPTWLVLASCARATVHGLSCQCEPGAHP